MALIRRPADFKHTEHTLAKAVACNYMFSRRFQVMIPNCYTSQDNEADILGIKSNNYCDEFEIKLSKADFDNDAKKLIQYRDMNQQERKLGWDARDPDMKPWQMPKQEALQKGLMVCNRFWFIVPSELHTKIKVPSWAGLITVLGESGVRVRQEPKKLHSRKMDNDDRNHHASKLGDRYWKTVNGVRYHGSR
ncbi:MAG: hypothetical protein OEX12_08890 [Gammaproteobacteria bacterium]|nr:hypothetical protein [Gammaproteobacteria bacterium]